MGISLMSCAPRTQPLLQRKSQLLLSTFDAGWYQYLIEAFDDDADIITINMIVNFGYGGILWVERFRLDMQAVKIVVPQPEELRFVMIKM